MNTCGTCRYAVIDGEEVGCHRYPPHVVDTLIGTEYVWPSLGVDDWCGEWAAKVPDP